MRSGLPYRVKRRWFERKELHDLILERVVEHRRQLDRACAAVVSITGAHGYEFQHELVLLEDGSLWKGEWSDVGPSGPQDLVAVVHPIDLAGELAQLHTEFPSRGSVLPAGLNRGRVLSLYVATRSTEQWVEGTSRLIGAPHQGTLDRIADAVCGRSVNTT